MVCHVMARYKMTDLFSIIIILPVIWNTSSLAYIYKSLKPLLAVYAATCIISATTPDVSEPLPLLPLIQLLSHLFSTNAVSNFLLPFMVYLMISVIFLPHFFINNQITKLNLHIEVLALVGWWEVWRPHPPKVDPGAFSGQRQGWKTPRAQEHSGSALLLCV